MLSLQSQPQDRTHAYRTPLKRIRAAIRAKKDFIFEKDLEDEDGTQSSAALCIVDAEVSEDVTRGLMFSEEEYSFMKYEHPLVTDLRLTEVSNVNERLRR